MGRTWRQCPKEAKDSTISRKDFGFQGKRFLTNNEVKGDKNLYFEDLNQSYYKKGIEMLKDPWNECIKLKGVYVEK